MRTQSSSVDFDSFYFSCASTVWIPAQLLETIALSESLSIAYKYALEIFRLVPALFPPPSTPLPNERGRQEFIFQKLLEAAGFNTMALAESCLQEKVKKFELRGLETIKFSSSFLTKLDEVLQDAYGILSPTPNDYKLRKELVQIFNFMTEEIYGISNGFPKVEAFGSFTMDIFTAKSDLDLSINFSNNSAEFPRKDMISTLKKFSKRLYALQRRGHVSCVQPIMTARVPILKLVDCGTGIECDLSVENKYGIAKSKILALISSIDERFRKLSFLGACKTFVPSRCAPKFWKLLIKFVSHTHDQMKTWCKAHDINSSKDRTLNSLSIISLVAFHLQTRDPPILPPFASLFKDGIDLANLENVLQGYQQFGKGNKESLAELFVALLAKLSSVETLWQYGLCVSTYTGSWILKTWESEIANMSVQDFMEQSENTARSVGKVQLQKIYKCIHGTLDQLASFMKGQIQEPQIKQLLFGSDALLAPGLPFIYNANLKRIQKSGDSNQKKKAKKARDTKSARSNEFSDSSKFILKGVDGINSVASMPNNGLGHKGDNHCLGERGQFPQTGSSHPQIEFVGTTAQTSTVSVSQQLQTGSQHSSMGLERQHILNAVDKKSDTGQRHIPTAQTGSQHPQIGYIGSAAQNSTVSNPSVSQQPQTGSQHPSVGPNSQQLPNPVVQKTGNGERCIPTAHTRSQHPQIGLVGSAAQDSTVSSPSVSQLPQTGPQHPSMGLNKQHIPNPMVQKTYTGQTCIPIAQTGSQHSQMGFVGSAAQNSTVSNPGVSQWPPWPQTGSQHPSMRLSGQHIPNPKFQKTDTGQRCIPTAQKGSQHLQIGLVGSAALNLTASKPSVSQWAHMGSQNPSVGFNRQQIPNPVVQKTDTWERYIPIAQRASQNPQVGLVGSAAQNSTWRSPSVSQWPQWPQTGSQHPSMGLNRQHSPKLVVQNTDTGQTSIPNGDEQTAGSQQMQGGFFRPHGSNQLFLMPLSLQGCNFSFQWGPHVYSGGHL